MDNLEGIEFSRVRRGYEPDEVRGALGTIGRQVRALTEERDRLVAQLERAEEKVAELRDAPTPTPAREDLTRMLGDEMVKLLDSARATADDIVSRATAEGEETLQRARDDADAVRAENEATLAARREEAAEEESAILGRAESFLAERMREADAAAEAVRRQMEIEAEAAKDAAKAQLDAAREEGKEMIVEARQFREKILRDLAGRRKVARKQLEAMRAAQERLLEAFTSCAVAVEGATSELHTALPAARAAADIAADRVDDDIEQVVRQLEDAIHTGELPAVVVARMEPPQLRSNALPRSSAAAAESLPEVDDDPESSDEDMSVLAISDGGADVVADEPLLEEFTDAPAIDDADEFAVDVAAMKVNYPQPHEIADVAEDEPADDRPRFGVIDGDGLDAQAAGETQEALEALFEDDLADDADEDEFDDDDDVEPSRPSLRLLTADPAEPADDGELSDTEADLVDAFDDDPDVGPPTAEFAVIAADEAAPDTFADDSFTEPDADELALDDDTGHAVDDLFARLRADRDAAVTEARSAIESATTEAEAERPADADDLIDARDEAVGPIERNLARRFKRVLDDEQNEMLDALRRLRRGADTASLLPDADVALDAYLDVVHEELTHAVAAGAASLRDHGLSPHPMDADVVADGLRPVLSAVLVEPWLDTLGELLGRGDDAATVTSGVRTAYRYRKMDDLADISGAVVVAAYNLGVAAAAAKGTALEWVVDHTDATETDVHFDPVRAGDAEKAVAILAESVGSGCRCVLAPVDRR